MEFFNEDLLILRNMKALGFAPATIYDVGASNGGWSHMCATIFPDCRYELFEPLARSDAGYQKGVEELAQEGLNFGLHEIICQREDGPCSFHVNASEYGPVGSTSILEGDVDNFASQQSFAHSLDTFQKRLGLPYPDLIKMDIQGGELEALMGATELLKSCTALILETWLARGYGPRTPLLGELLTWLAERGFAVFEFGGQYRMGDPPALITQDIAFVRCESELGELLNARYHDRRSLA